jgi:hypothetical protein
MTDHIDTRDGWREVTQEESERFKGPSLIWDGLTHRRWFVPEEPVPALPETPLPTEKRDALWAIYDRYTIPNDTQEERGLGFDAFMREVLAALEWEPRAVTAKAVLDRVRDEGILRNANAHDVADEIATEFGVIS